MLAGAERGAQSFEDLLRGLRVCFKPNELRCRFPVELRRAAFVCGAAPSAPPVSPSRRAPRATHTFSSTQHLQQQAFQPLALAAARFSPPQRASFVLLTAPGPISPPDPFSLRGRVFFPPSEWADGEQGLHGVHQLSDTTFHPSAAPDTDDYLKSATKLKSREQMFDNTRRSITDLKGVEQNGGDKS